MFTGLVVCWWRGQPTDWGSSPTTVQVAKCLSGAGSVSCEILYAGLSTQQIVIDRENMSDWKHRGSAAFGEKRLSAEGTFFRKERLPDIMVVLFKSSQDPCKEEGLE